MVNVLIPTDFSGNSWNAMEYALEFFKNKKCNFHFLHVVKQVNFVGGEVFAFPASEVIEKEFLKNPKQKIHNAINKIRTTINNPNHRFFALADYDYLVDSIRKHVIEKKIDFIITGTKGATGIKKMLIGSNTADIITKVKCATLVIPEKAKYTIPKEITFPTDFSMFYSIESLQPLLEISEEHNSKIRVLHVMNNKNEKLTHDQITIREYLIDYFNKTDLSFHYLINKDLDEAIEYFVTTRETQMIVMVAKNLNFFQQILFSPTVEEVTYHTNIPFLVLHE